MAKPSSARFVCNCSTGGKCDSGLCPRVAVTATREAGLPAGSPGVRAAERIAKRMGQ